ncbi:molybdopterin oxidoreductase [bacterium]|nr:molybdopterin oxidoreductase [bacterium]
MPKALAGLMLAFVVVGVVSFLHTLKIDEQRAWTGFLHQYFYWLCLGLGGLFFTALQHITGSYWSVTVRRIAEVFSAYLPVALVLFFVLLAGSGHLFEWMHADVVAHDHLLQGKSAYLNKPFFIIRALFLFGVCFTLGYKMICNSLKQDETGDAALTLKNTKMAPLFLFLFGWGFTFVTVDLIMSLSPHWFSTIFGVYCWAGLFSSTLAMLALWVLRLKRKGILAGFVNENHLHDIGKLMFAFMVFWAYTGFSQFMLIWYGNLPEENFFYLNRIVTEGSISWLCISRILMVGHFGLPFLLFIGRKQKRNEIFLMCTAIWYLIFQWIDIYWLVYPTFYKIPVFGFYEVGLFLGFLGLFVLSVGFRLSRVSPVAYRDPRMEDALHHHQ